MKKIPPIWALMALKHATETISIVGFHLGDEGGARRMLADRTKEEHYDDAEVFNFSLPAPKMRYLLELWLVGTGMSKEDAAEQVTIIAKSVGDQMRRVMKRKK